MKSSLNPAAPAFGTKSTSNLCVHSNKGVLLQTARATPDNQLEVRILLDSGSKKSFISERAKDLLNLKSRDRMSSSIMAFGCRERKQQNCYSVKVGVQLKDGQTQELCLLTIPFICEPLTAPTLQLHPQHHKHLCQLDLADTYEGGEPFQPDILVGSDQYWNLITGETIHESGGLAAVHTHLGWALSGPVTLPTESATSVNCVVHVLKVDADNGDTFELNNQLRAFWEWESLGVFSAR